MKDVKSLETLGSVKEVPAQLGAESTEFESAYGEPFSKTLDLDTWTLGEDLWTTYSRLEQEVAEALLREDEYRRQIRELVSSDN